MKNIYELIQEKNSLPKGRIYKKTINGNTYYYHQFPLNNKKLTIYVKPDQVLELQKAIEHRLEIEKEIKQILDSGNRKLSLSASAREFTGSVMKSDLEVARFEKGNLIYINEQFAPLIIKRSKQLEPFLKYRSIDSGRTNSRILKKILKIDVKDDVLVSLCSYAASISDDYWFKPKHSKLKYKDVAFNNDIFFDTSLKGLISVYPNKIVLTPELTTNGSYEKGWKNINGQWWLYKVGSKREIFSEMFYSRLFEELNLPTAHYEYDGTYIRSLNFSENYNFEPMSSLVGDNEDMFFIYKTLNDISHQIALDYLRLCFFDIVLNNVDRHNENCGILRNRNSGEIISLAPNYDDNLCLISRNDILIPNTDEGFLKSFIKDIQKNNELKNAYKEVNIPNINLEILNKVIEQISIEVDKKMITEYILLRYNYLKNFINN